MNPDIAREYRAAPGYAVGANLTPTQLLCVAFRYHRRDMMHDKADDNAVRAMSRARHDAAAGKVRYPSSAGNPGYGPEFAAYGEHRLRWIERPAACGLRFVGYADELNRAITHTGWFVDEQIQDETTRGVVYQLPARDGSPLYVVGCSDPYNDGPACLSFDDVTDDKTTAANWADSLAERMAEDTRDYESAYRAGFEYAESAAEISTLRRSTLALIRDAKAACDKLSPAIRDALRAMIERNRDAINELRERRETLAEQFDHTDAFNNGVTDHG